VREQLLLYIRMLTPKTRQELASEIGRLEARRDALDAEIAALKQRSQVKVVDPAAIASAVRSRLTNLAEAVPTLPPHVLKQVLSALTASLEVDMETKAVSFAFHLPSWAVWHHGDADLTQLCLRHSSESSTGLRTQLTLAAADCEFRWKRGSTTEPPCYDCRRRAA
jgi:chorismate mutase